MIMADILISFFHSIDCTRQMRQYCTKFFSDCYIYWAHFFKYKKLDE